jgi:hypothetical protein
VVIDEELNRLEDNIRRLKIEFEAYFNGGQPRPPNDTLYRVEQAVKKHSSDTSKLSASQRFRFNQLVQRYAVYNELWRKRLRYKEEGKEMFPHKHGAGEQGLGPPVHVVCSDPDREQEKVDQLLQALIEAKRRVSGGNDNVDPQNFRKFVREKTLQLKQTLGCEKIEFSVEIVEGQVRFTAGKAE